MSVGQKIKHELIRLFPTVLYFFITFNLVAACYGLMIKNYKGWMANFLILSAGSLIVGKAVLIADALPFVDKFPDKPLIYNTVWKTSIYVTLAMIIRYLERLVHFSIHYGGLASGNHHLIAETIWPRFLGIHILILGLFLAYVCLLEFDQKMGHGNMRKMFLGK